MAKHGARFGLLGGWKGFGLGIAASVLIAAVAPELGKSVGPAARSALKLLFRASDQLARATARTREQAEDFVASVKAEYEAEQEAAPSTGGGHPPAPRVDGDHAAGHGA